LKVDLVIKNSKIYVRGLVLDGGIAVDDGKIVAIAKDATLLDGEQTIDARGNLVLPGLIDAHVHFRDPGFTHKEDFLTGSQGAAAGGVTTVIDEPNTNPTTTSLEALDQKKRVAESKSIVDFTFSVGLNPQNLGEISEFVSQGISSFDIFGGGLGERLSISDTGTLYEALTLIKKAGALCCLSLGGSSLSRWQLQKIQQSGRKDVAAYIESSLGIGEAISASKNLPLTEYVGVRAHLRQISTSSTVRVLERLKAKGQNMSSEVSPHHLLLTTEDVKRLGPYGKVGPPIGTKEDAEALWSALADGTIDMIATDHAPHTREEKDAGWEDIWKAPSGLPEVETTLPLMLTQFNKGRIGLGRLVEATSEMPAKIFNLYPRKGAIQVGSDADLVIVDLNRKGRILGERLHSKIRHTPFEGWEVQGIPVMTMVRGMKVMEEGEILGKPGCGAFIPATTTG